MLQYRYHSAASASTPQLVHIYIISQSLYIGKSLKIFRLAFVSVARDLFCRSILIGLACELVSFVSNEELEVLRLTNVHLIVSGRDFGTIPSRGRWLFGENNNLGEMGAESGGL